MQTNVIYNEECIAGMKKLPDKSVDLIVTDPPYNFEAFGGGFYDSNSNIGHRDYLTKLQNLNCAEYNPEEFLGIAKRILKKFNLVVFCNKFLIKNYIEFAVVNGYKFDIHVMIKNNPIPAKNNHFLHDIEYIVVIRETGAAFSLDQQMRDYKKSFSVNCR